MRALMLRDTVGPSGLKIEDVPVPEAQDDMVLIDVRTAGVGFVDMLITKGEYQIKPPLPFIPGMEIAGTVRSAPAGSSLVVGQRVAAMTFTGGYAEVAAAPTSLTFPLPDGVDDVTAAGAVINAGTAHLGLVRRGRLAAGETLLVHGAAGGTGLAAIGVAKALGARVIAAASTDEKRAAALAAGADEAIDSTGEWGAAVKELTGGRGADVVWDPVGGDVAAGSLRCMAPEGRLLVVGFAGGTIPEIKVNRLLLRSHDVVGVNYGGFIAADPTFPARTAAETFGWMAEGRMHLDAGPAVPLEQGPAVLQGFADRTVVGKPVLQVA
ncbi:zinc containing alcohol dehydrogenase superfamily protein [Paraconexibacter sp. AEG42_29]|uniref:Zinc containing alcohol dehydrogenase superfamily protein n=1 Tax=Paraconexibacter sp. AEG42_29 TaxID=2997339 RepID=A0AAU7ASV6_9ACTN